MSDLSASTKALLRAAKGDAPSQAARAKIWSAVGAGSAAGAGAGAAAGAGVGKAALAGSAKLLVMGALFGSAVTVGVASVALHVGPTPSLRPEPTYAIAPERASCVAPAARALAAAPADPAPAVAPPHAAPPARVDRRRPRGDDEPLAREAALLAEARGALVRGQPDAALAAVRAARSLPVRALEPETLALEARALRAEGHFDEADAAEAKLRARFPENALAR